MVGNLIIRISSKYVETILHMVCNAERHKPYYITTKMNVITSHFNRIVTFVRDACSFQKFTSHCR